MKKFLFFALVVSDLLAMNPDKVFDLACCENPTEQQVKALHDAWDECLRDQVKSAQIANEEHKKDPYSEAFKKMNTRAGELYVELQTYLSNELELVSREVETESEKTAAEQIKRYFSTENDLIEKVRVIDAESYINGLYLSRAEKDKFLEALTSDDELLRQVDIFCENHRFSNMSLQLLNNLRSGNIEIPDNLDHNPMLESTIRRHLIQDSKESRVYRDAMVSYMARERAFDFISDYYSVLDKFEDKLIVKHTEGMMSPVGLLCYQYSFAYTNSLFRSADSISGQNAPWLFNLDPKLIFFHEVGHVNDFFTFANVDLRMNQTDKIISALFDIEADLKEFDSARPFLLKGLKSDEKMLRYLKNSLETEETDFEKILGLLRCNLTNPLFLSKFSLSTLAEVWQIFGILLSCCDNEKGTLYINKMSDFALFCELGLPIRCDHLGYADTEKDSSNNKKIVTSMIKKMLKYNLPLDAYGALMEFHDISMQSYVLKLMYPYGLISQLQSEYRLNSNLKEFKLFYGQFQKSKKRRIFNKNISCVYP